MTSEFLLLFVLLLYAGQSGSEDIQQHKFFSSINWEALFKKETAPPFKPSVTGDDDVSNVRAVQCVSALPQ